MNNNAWFKKEKPLLSLQSMGGGASGTLMQGAADKTYVDDVFSTYLYKGTSANQAVNNNINLADEGGIVWLKARSTTYDHWLFDTVRGSNKAIRSNLSNAEITDTTYMNAFNNNGFTVGSNGSTNYTGVDFASWTFRKTPGFCDVVTWTGTGSYRTLDHNLGCVPGFIMLKQTSGTESWICWHRYMGSGSNAHYLNLNSNAAMGTDGGGGSNPNASVNSVSSTQFTVGADNNGSGGTWVAYLFAGGSANSEDLARSVDFDGSGDDLTIGSSSDWGLGTGDFTWEAWIKPTQAWNSGVWETVFMVGTTPETGGLWIGKNTSDQFVIRAFSDQDLLTCSILPTVGIWTHIAAARSGTTLKLFYNGIEQNSVTTSYDFQTGSNARIANDGHNQRFTGKVSNLRLVKGTAVYTSDFVPSDSLTNITNTVLLCCNNSSITGSTVTPATITSNGDPSADTDSPPFADAEANIFGADSDQGIVKCGSYIGNGSTTGPEIYLGWEPSWVLIKDTSASVNWRLHDSMRGITTGGDDPEMEPNTNDAESDSDRLSLTPTGFKLTTSSASHNDPGDVYLYVAIRRPDGYVGKPAEAGTDVFTMAVGNGSGIEPAFTSGFPIDFAFGRQPASVDNWYAWARFMQGKYLKTNGTAYQLNDGAAVFDWNTGFNLNYPSSYQSWMWKRGQGFDVVTYKGDGAARTINHSLNAVPQMMWIKDRTTTGGGGSPWYVYHSDTADSGMGYGYLNSDDAFSSSGLGGAWNSTAPTSTHFSLGTWAGVNYSGASFIAMLFSSVNGISKVGSYTGNDTSQSISLGFQPRFLILKNATSTEKWYVLDTVRGWVSGADEYMSLNTDYAQVSSNTFGEPTATGFDISGSDNWNNANGETFIYYAHA